MKTRVQLELDEADRLISAGELFSAAVALGGLWSGRSRLAADARTSLEQSVRRRLVALSVAELQSSVTSRIERLERVVCAGGRYEFEELVLALTLRIEIAVVTRAVAEVSGAMLEADTRACDVCLCDIAEERKSKDAYTAAASAIVTNWQQEAGLDFDDLGVRALIPNLDEYDGG